MPDICAACPFAGCPCEWNNRNQSAALASARANARSEPDQPDAACAAGTEEQR